MYHFSNDAKYPYRINVLFGVTNQDTTNLKEVSKTSAPIELFPPFIKAVAPSDPKNVPADYTGDKL